MSFDKEHKIMGILSATNQGELCNCPEGTCAGDHKGIECKHFIAMNIIKMISIDLNSQTNKDIKDIIQETE